MHATPVLLLHLLLGGMARDAKDWLGKIGWVRTQ